MWFVLGVSHMESNALAHRYLSVPTVGGQGGCVWTWKACSMGREHGSSLQCQSSRNLVSHGDQRSLTWHGWETRVQVLEVGPELQYLGAPFTLQVRNLRRG